MEFNCVDTIIEELCEMIQGARGVPLSSNKCILERDKALDLLDEIIAALPDDIKKARTIVNSRNELIGQARQEAETTINSAQAQASSAITFANSEADKIRAGARTEAESIIAKAKEQAQNMVTQEAVYKEARKQSQEMIDKTNAQIAELRKTSNRYMDDTLKNTEEAIAAALKDVKATRAKFQSLTGEQKKEPVEKKQSTTFKDIDIG